jgi:acyl-CoA thioesterase II
MSVTDARLQLAQDVLRSLDLNEIGNHEYEGMPPATFQGRSFGGQVVGMATAAVMRSSGSHTAPHSLHGYFLRAVTPLQPVQLRVESIRAGRSFRTFEVRMTQNDKLAFVATCQFHIDEPGVEYQPAMPQVPPPDLVDEHWRQGPIESRSFGPTPLRDDGTFESTRRAWLRFLNVLPDDPVITTAMAAYVSDLTGNAYRLLSLDRYEGFVDASLDHAIWFHRPMLVDDWVFYDLQCTINHGSRSHMRGAMYDADGQLCLSMAQELLIRPL